MLKKLKYKIIERTKYYYYYYCYHYNKRNSTLTKTLAKMSVNMQTFAHSVPTSSIACRNGANCRGRNGGCLYLHPPRPAVDPTAAAAAAAAAAAIVATIACRNGANCRGRNGGCLYLHPSRPAAAAHAAKVSVLQKDILCKDGINCSYLQAGTCRFKHA